MKFLYNTEYPNNFNLFFLNDLNEVNIDDQDEDEEDYLKTFYKMKFSKKYLFFRKTVKGVKNNVKLMSLKRNKNFDLNNLMLNSWIKKGLKLNFLKNYNIFLQNFWFLMNNDKYYFKDKPNFEFVFDFLKRKRYNFNVLNLLIEPLFILEHMFDLKLKRLNKKMKRKYKKKYIYVINYLHRSKRLKTTLSMFYLSSNNYNNKKYYDRIFFTFLNIIFDTKNTPIWNKKLNVYKIALKFLKKK